MKFISTFALSLLLSTLIPAAAAAQHTPTAVRHFPADEHLRPILRYLVEDQKTPGIVLGVLEADGSTRVLSHGSGGAGTRPLGAKSIFDIGSITKVFTTTLLADAVARGEITSLDDPISRYLPEGVSTPRWEGREITLLDLATHASGLPRFPDNHEPADPQNPYADYDAAKLYAFLSAHQLRRSPGAELEYSNVGVGLLGHLIERAVGVPLEQLVKERILDPLGMTMTGFHHEGEAAGWMTKGHRRGEEVPAMEGGVLAGAGGLRSNAEDLLRFLAANMAEPKTPLQRAMREAQKMRRSRGEGRAVGLGWGIRTRDDRLIYTHSGGTAGFRTMIGFDPVRKIGFFQLANSGEFDDDPGADFLNRGAIERTEVEVPRELLDLYAGEYATSPDRTLQVRLEPDGYLTAQFAGQARWVLYPSSPSEFFFRRTPMRVSFRTGDDGEVTELLIHQNGSTRTAERKQTAPATPE